MAKKKIPKGWVTAAEFTKLTGISNASILTAASRGNIPEESFKRIGKSRTSPLYLDPVNSSVFWYGRLNATHHLTRSLREKLLNYILTFNPDFNKPISESNKKEEENKEEKVSLYEAQRLEKVAKAEKAQLELEAYKGSLLSKDKVADQLFSAGKEIREALLSIPDRITDEIIASVNNRNKVNSLIYEAIASTLEKLTDLNNKKLG